MKLQLFFNKLLTSKILLQSCQKIVLCLSYMGLFQSCDAGVCEEEALFNDSQYPKKLSGEWQQGADVRHQSPEEGETQTLPTLSHMVSLKMFSAYDFGRDRSRIFFLIYYSEIISCNVFELRMRKTKWKSEQHHRRVKKLSVNSWTKYCCKPRSSQMWF